MSEHDENGVDLTLENQEELDSETNDESEDDGVDWKAEAQKNKDLANNYKIRAEKAEKSKTEVKDVKPQPAQQGYTLQDQMALLNAKVEIEDIDIVVDYAKYKGISITEALKSSVIKAELAEKQEFRNSSEASNVGNSKRVSNKTSDGQLLSNASKGIMPESDEDMERLVSLQIRKR